MIFIHLVLAIYIDSTTYGHFTRKVSVTELLLELNRKHYCTMAASKDSDTFTKAKPGLVVFDLDYTLWPFWIDTHHDPPFSKKGSRIVDRHGQTVKFYPEVPQVLEYLSQENIPMAIASRTSETDGANELISLFGWNKYFVYKEIYPGCKLNHFQVFQDKSKVPYKSMLFFDDEHRNIKDLSSKGVNCILVEKGVNMQLVQDALKKFEKNCG